MSEIKIEKLKKIIYTFSELANIKNQDTCNNLINHLSTMNEEDVIDYLIVTLSDFVRVGKLKIDDIFSNINIITDLSSKYPTKESLIERLNWLKSMNMEHSQMPLSENHKLVLEVFDKFNEIIGINFDAYYTGGLMGYLAIKHPLERYHGDLDLFINEEQLESLYELVKQSDDFTFVSNMNDKEENGHEFKIQYKDTPMSIGLFLFERKSDNEIVTKEYFHKNNNQNEELLVNEHHLVPEYAQMIFSDQIRQHNGIPYKMQSLESIYNSKKNSRTKDRYDASIIKDNINLMIDYSLDTKKHNNYDIKHKNADVSVVAEMEKELNNK